MRPDPYDGKPPDEDDREPPPAKITVVLWEAYGPSPGCRACIAGGPLFDKDYHDKECRRRFAHLYAGYSAPLPKATTAKVASRCGLEPPSIDEETANVQFPGSEAFHRELTARLATMSSSGSEQESPPLLGWPWAPRRNR